MEALTLKGLSVVLQLPERERLDYNWLDNMKTMPHIPPRSSVGEGRREGRGGEGERGERERGRGRGGEKERRGGGEGGRNARDEGSYWERGRE